MTTRIKRQAETVRATALNALRENVLVFRAQVGLSQTAFAERAYLARPVVSKLEQGIEQPSFDSLAKIAAVIGCEISELLLHRHQEGETSEAELKRRAKLPSKNDVEVDTLLNVIEEANATRYSKRGRKPAVAHHRRPRHR